MGLLVACNLGQSNDSIVSVQGNWSGTYSTLGSGTSIPIFALMQENGPAYLFDSSGIVYRLPTFTGSRETSGNVTAYPATGYKFADGNSSEPLTMDAIAQGSQLDIDLDGPDGSNQDQQGSAELLHFETYSGHPSIQSGQWTGYYISPTPESLGLAVAADGSFTGNDAYGCSLTGQLTPVEAGSTLFAVSLKSSGTSPACGGAMTGLAHESDDDSFGFFQYVPGIYYYLCASNAGAAFVAEFRVE